MLSKLRCLIHGHNWEREDSSFNYHSGTMVYKERCARCDKFERNGRCEKHT